MTTLTIENIRLAQDRIDELPIVIVHPDDANELKRMFKENDITWPVVKYSEHAPGSLLKPPAFRW